MNAVHCTTTGAHKDTKPQKPCCKVVAIEHSSSIPQLLCSRFGAMWDGNPRQNGLFSHRVYNMQGKQHVRFSPLLRLTASSAPPTTHAVLFPLFTMIGRNPPPKMVHRAHLAVLTDVGEEISSTSPTTCLKKSVLRQAAHRSLLRSTSIYSFEDNRHHIPIPTTFVLCTLGTCTWFSLFF